MGVTFLVTVTSPNFPSLLLQAILDFNYSLLRLGFNSNGFNSLFYTKRLGPDGSPGIRSSSFSQLYAIRCSGDGQTRPPL